MLWVAVTIASAFVLFVLVAYWREWQWTGLVEVRRKAPDGEDVQASKTLWDWLQIRVVPLALGALAFALNAAQEKRQRAT